MIEARILGDFHQEVDAGREPVFDQDLNIRKNMERPEPLNRLLDLISGDGDQIADFQSGICDDRSRFRSALRIISFDRNAEDLGRDGFISGCGVPGNCRRINGRGLCFLTQSNPRYDERADEAKENEESELTHYDRNPETDRKSTRLNSSHIPLSRMPSSA